MVIRACIQARLYVGIADSHTNTHFWLDSFGSQGSPLSSSMTCSSPGIISVSHPRLLHLSLLTTSIPTPHFPSPKRSSLSVSMSRNFEQIATKMGRTQASVRHRLERLEAFKKLPEPPHTSGRSMWWGDAYIHRDPYVYIKQIYMQYMR